MSTLHVFIYGGYVNNSFFGSILETTLNGTMLGMRLLNGCRLFSNNANSIVDCTGKLSGEYNLVGYDDIGGKIESDIYISHITQRYDLNINDIYNLIGVDYEEYNDYPFIKFVTKHGTYMITNVYTHEIWEADVSFYNVDIKPTVKLINYNYDYYEIKKTIDNIHYDLYEITITDMLKPKTNTINQTMSEYEERMHKQKIKARTLEQYNKYRQYLYKIPIDNMTREQIIKTYNSYSKIYAIDVCEVDGDILGLYVIGKR